MPKIRLSALAVDMKGKSGGSVFSTNSGGTYFRNNPSGGGRKSERWNLRKSQFAFVSGQWRNLSAEQRSTWDAARSNFPTTNAFGEPRLPSAFELFMRLNSALYIAGLRVLPEAPSPESFDEFDSLETYWPDAWCFVPQQCTRVAYSPAGDKYARIELSDFEDPINAYGGVSLYFRFQLDTFHRVPREPYPVYRLFETHNSEDTGLVIQYVQTLKKQGFFEILFKNGLTTGSLRFDYNQELFERMHSLSLSMVGVNSGSWELKIDNVLLTASLVEGISSNSVQFIGPFILGFTVNDSYSPFFVSDFRFFSDNCSPETWSKICNGYEAPQSLAWFGFEAWDGDYQVNYGMHNPAAFAALIDGPESGARTSPIGQTFSPTLFLLNPVGIDSTQILQLYASPGLSAGKTSEQSRRRLIAQLVIQGEPFIDVTAAYRSAFGGAANGSYVQLSASVLNPNTGQVVPIAGPKRKTGPRFRSGAELANKV